jgi:hypothetical protein
MSLVETTEELQIPRSPEADKILVKIVQTCETMHWIRVANTNLDKTNTDCPDYLYEQKRLENDLELQRLRRELVHYEQQYKNVD